MHVKPIAVSPLTEDDVEHGHVGEEAEDEGDAVECGEDGDLAGVEDDARGRAAAPAAPAEGRGATAGGPSTNDFRPSALRGPKPKCDHGSEISPDGGQGYGEGSEP